MNHQKIVSKNAKYNPLINPLMLSQVTILCNAFSKLPYLKLFKEYNL